MEDLAMTHRDHIPLGVGFYPDWFHKNAGLSFGKQYYFDPETRVEARMAMDKLLYERFGDVGLGDPHPRPKPLITAGMITLPAVFGCEILYEEDALPWAVPLNLSEEQVMKLEVPDLLHSWPMTEWIKQVDYLKSKYGAVVGDINSTGIQNLALKIRGDQLYIDYFEKPDLCHHLLRICTECVKQVFEFNYRAFGTGAMDVTPMADPSIAVIPNCTEEQISNRTYETFLLDYDNEVADAFRSEGFGIHHCGSVDQLLEGYTKVRHLKFIEIGFGSDVRRCRDLLGPGVAVNARISPVLMKNGTPGEVEAEVKRLIDHGHPLHNFSIDTVGLTYGTLDENVKTARRTAADYGKIPLEASTESEHRRFHSIPQRGAAVETRVSSVSRTVVIGPHHPLVVIGERINPTGRKKVRQAIEKGDLRALQKEAVRQVKEGAHILDVNVGVSGIDEPRMLREAIMAIQEVCDVPLCIDSASPKALEAGLQVYQGKAIVNSVNGEKRKLETVLPLVRKYGAAVIGLTMDDQGIPKEAEKRLDIARLLLREAEALGIPLEDMIIDPLAMATSVDHHAGIETMKALQLIRDELGVNQTLGVSNISFGLPERSSVNAVFLPMAVMSGLTCAIVDPTVWEVRNAVLISDMLLGRDQFCMNYISIAGKRRKVSRPQEKGTASSALEALKEAVVLGRRIDAVTNARKALDERVDPHELINRYLIPALNIVGEKFEKRDIFIPEMMMSAKTVQACVDLIKPLLGKDGNRSLGTVLLGTVFGDLHDIGKNLAKLLLETSGFKVIDLGENVPAQRFVEAAREHKAVVVGLSSLLTTGDPYVEETVRALRDSDVRDRVKIVCGGAALTPRFVMETCGADAYAKDAAEGVKKIKKLLGIPE
jgi:methanogenic corrinoid protein MtbC1/uroporphyrinogen-III decarboxylase